MSDQFPTEIVQFIDRHIESLAQLEALLLLRNEPGRSWRIDEIAKALYASPEMAAALINDLMRRGFVRNVPPDQQYVYQPPDESADRLLAQLESIYHTRRVAVISQIYSKPLNKVQTFADAFRLRKEDPS